MPDKPRPVLRIGSDGKPHYIAMLPNDEHRTAAERRTFAEMLKDASDG